MSPNINRIAFCPSISSNTGFASIQSIKDFNRFSSDIGFRVACSKGTPTLTRPFSIAQYYSGFLKTFDAADVFVTIYPYCCNSISHRVPMYLLDAYLTRFLTSFRPGSRSVLYIVDLPIDQSSELNHNQLNIAHKVEGEIFKSYDVLCVFNSNMKEHIKDLYSIPDDRFVEFEMLDFGVDFIPLINETEVNGSWNIVYAGSATEQYMGKWPLDTIPAKGVRYEFFGKGGEWLRDSKRSDIVFQGALPQADLIDYLARKAHFGIIYYQRAKGTEYIEYGSTSKFSNYLAAGIPIITSKSHQYISGLVAKYDIGITFESVTDIPEILECLPVDRYLELKRNAQRLGENVREGYFFKRAITESLEILGLNFDKDVVPVTR